MSDDGSNDEAAQPTPTMSGWADAMSKILGSNKPKKKKKLILSRAKKDYEVSTSNTTTQRKAGLEVVPAEVPAEGSADVQEEENRTVVTKPKKRKIVVDELEDSLLKKRKTELKQKRLQKEWENLNRVRPDNGKDREKERHLIKIATKGVVELFNAVNLQKNTLRKKLRNAPRSEFKRDKVLSETKDLFEDALETVTKKKKR